MGEKLAALRESGVARLGKKFMDDRGLDLAILLAWGTLNTLFPVILGLTAIAGLVLRDDQRLQELNSAMLQLLPADVAQPLTKVLDDTRKSAAALGIVGFALLLVNGSGFFANMESVFNRAYRVADRGFVMQRVIALVMLVIAAVLLILSTSAYGVGNFLATASDWLFTIVPFEVPGRGLLGIVIGSTLSILLAFATFATLYTVLPNRRHGLKQVLPGSAVAAVLFFLILQLFPVYLTFFGQSFQTYAVFGMFLLLMFWCYLLGIILVLGAELNAFLELPALADQPAPAGPLGAPASAPGPKRNRPTPGPRGFKGRLVGVTALLVAAALNRRRSRHAG